MYDFRVLGFIVSYFRHPQSALLRKLLFQIHLWGGIGIGIYLSVICISGSALIFREEMGQAMNPSLYNVRRMDSPTATPLVVFAQRSGRRFLRIQLPAFIHLHLRRSTYLVYVHRGTKYISILADPATAECWESCRSPESFTGCRNSISISSAGRTGRIVNGTGSTSSPDPGPHRNGDLVARYCELGAEASELIFGTTGGEQSGTRTALLGSGLRQFVIGWALTGAYFAFPKQVQSIVERISPVTAYSYPSSNPTLKYTQPSPRLETLIDSAQKQLPASQIVGISIPSDDRGTILVELTRTRPSDYNNKGYVYFYFDSSLGNCFLSGISTMEPPVTPSCRGWFHCILVHGGGRRNADPVGPRRTVPASAFRNGCADVVESFSPVFVLPLWAQSRRGVRGGAAVSLLLPGFHSILRDRHCRVCVDSRTLVANWSDCYFLRSGPPAVCCETHSGSFMDWMSCSGSCNSSCLPTTGDVEWPSIRRYCRRNSGSIAGVGAEG